MNAKSVLMSTSTEIQRLDNNILAAHTVADGADTKADKALYSISTHEQICSLRYSSIDEKLKTMNRTIWVGLLIIAMLMKSDKLLDVLKVIGFGV